jgi:hypothetical protein
MKGLFMVLPGVDPLFMLHNARCIIVARRTLDLGVGRSAAASASHQDAP